AGFLRVGWVAEFLSKPIVTGFVFGLTILVVIGELPNLLGIPVTPGDVLHRIYLLGLNIDQIKPLTAAVGVSALAVLFIGSRLLPRVPWAWSYSSLGSRPRTGSTSLLEAWPSSVRCRKGCLHPRSRSCR
ncbi:MAG TPA: SulP family inorganic anion transporter, partial [Mycobacterium sp.]|nr:SulP family inorganic anion transporter [Mycobacterium sp.]